MDNQTQQDYFLFYRSFYEAIKDLPSDDQLALYNATALYGLDGVTSELEGFAKTCFTLIQPVLEKSRRNVRNGRRGGLTPKSTNTEEAPSQS